MIDKPFRTTIKILEEYEEFGYQDQIVLIGSCFAENISNRLKRLKYDTFLNPFGIVYNPESIGNALDYMMEGKKVDSSDLFQHNELWHSPFHHTSFSGEDKGNVLEHINARIEKGEGYIKSCRYLFLTLGTAWVYENEEGNIVANCHKLPSSNFKKRLMNVDEVINSLGDRIAAISKINPALRIGFTVSPIRHLKDGFQENAVSKAILRAAINELPQIHSNCNYFPSYEIMMDDLRDYRFYEPDMIHPNSEALDYIWEIFKNAYIAVADYELQDSIEKINLALEHKPFRPQSEAHKKFLKRQLEQIETVQKKAPFLNFKEEKRQLKKSLSDS